MEDHVYPPTPEVLLAQNDASLWESKGKLRLLGGPYAQSHTLMAAYVHWGRHGQNDLPKLWILFPSVSIPSLNHPGTGYNCSSSWEQWGLCTLSLWLSLLHISYHHFKESVKAPRLCKFLTSLHLPSVHSTSTHRLTSTLHLETPRATLPETHDSQVTPNSPDPDHPTLLQNERQPCSTQLPLVLTSAWLFSIARITTWQTTCWSFIWISSYHQTAKVRAFVCFLLPRIVTCT